LFSSLRFIHSHDENPLQTEDVAKDGSGAVKDRQKAFIPREEEKKPIQHAQTWSSTSFKKFQQETKKCVVCGKTVYLTEQIVADEKVPNRVLHLVLQLSHFVSCTPSSSSTDLPQDLSPLHALQTTTQVGKLRIDGRTHLLQGSKLLFFFCCLLFSLLFLTLKLFNN
jgi:hypothetical protein